MNGSAMTYAEDKVLASRARVEPGAFAAIYDQYFPRIYNYVRYRIQDAQTSDDLTAQIFEKALTGIESYQSTRAPLVAWLFGIARHTVADHLRAQSRRRWLSLDILRERTSVDPEPEQVVIRDETHRRLLTAVNRLSDRDKEMIALKFGARLKNRQIASLTGLSETHVGVIVHRAIRRLRVDLVEKEQDSV